MSDIPYSVRDGNVRVNAIRGFNFADINTNEMFKKVDDNNVGGINVFATQTSTTNKLTMLAGTGLLTQTVGTIEGVTDLFTRSLHLNTFGDRNQGITIREDGISSRVGIGITQPEEDLEIDGNIQIDSANVARLKFKKSGNPATAHALGEIDGEEDENNGGALQFFTKVDGSPSVTEKLRINNIGAIGIGGANYGAAGSVLQSNGSGSSVSWRTPVILGASLSDVSYTGANPRSVVLYDNVEYETVECYEPTTGIFTAPRTAFYMVNAYARVTDFNAPFASRAQSYIYKKVGGVFTLYSATDVVDSQENYKGATPCTNIIIFLNSDEEIRHEVTFPSNTTYTYNIHGDDYEKRCSYLSIHSIT